MSLLTHLPVGLPVLSVDAVKATSIFSTSYYAHLAFDPSTSLLIGSWANNQWISGSMINTNQKLNADLGESIAFSGVYIVNGHSGGAYASSGIKNVQLYGTNSATAFANTDYSDLTDLTLLHSFEAEQFNYHDQYVIFANSTPYRYMVARIADNWGDLSYMGVRAFYPLIERDEPLVPRPEIGITGPMGVISTIPNVRTDRHILGGIIKVNGVPAKKRILIFDRTTNKTIASTYSDANTGEWTISNIPEYPERGLYAIAFDDTGEFNAEIADFVSQVAPA